MNTNTKYTLLGGLIGVGIGGLATYLFMRDKPIQNPFVETKDDGSGKELIEVTGDGGADDGVKVSGYVLPEDIKDVKFPLTVIVKPNENLLGGFPVGSKVTATHNLKNDVVFKNVKVGEVQGDYYIWYDTLKKQALQDAGEVTRKK